MNKKMVNDTVSYFSGIDMGFIQYDLYDHEPSFSIHCHFHKTFVSHGSLNFHCLHCFAMKKEKVPQRTDW